METVFNRHFNSCVTMGWYAGLFYIVFCLLSFVRFFTDYSLSISLCGIIYGVLGFSFIYYGPITRRYCIDLFSPLFLFFNAFGVYFATVLLFTPGVNELTVLYIVSTLFFFLIFFEITPRIKTVNFMMRFNGELKSPNVAIMRAVILQIVGFVCFAFLTTKAGYDTPWGVIDSPFAYRLYISSNGMSYIKTFVDFLIIGPVVVVFMHYCKRKLPWTIPASFLVFALIYTLLSGYRGQTIFLMLNLILIWHVIKHKISMGIIVVFGALVVPFAVLYGELRRADGGFSIENIRQFIENTSYDVWLTLFLNRLDAAIFFDKLVSDWNQLHPKLGGSYFELLIQPIPRSFFPNKPLLPNVELTTIMLPGQYEQSASYDFSVFGELYYNFLWVGVVVGGAVLAWMIRFLQNTFESCIRRKSDIDMLYLLAFYLFPVGVVVSGVVQAVIGILLNLMVTALLLILFFNRTKVGGV